MKIHKARILLGSVICIAIWCLLSPPPAMADETSFILKKDGEAWLTLRYNPQNEQWSAESPGVSLTVAKRDKVFEFETPNAVYHLEVPELGKLKLYSADGHFKLKVKFDGEKQKIYRREEGEADWVLKLKAEKGKFQVRQGEETEIGQLKFYPDETQVKVKDMEGAKLCSMQSNYLKSAPAVCFFHEMTEEEQLLVFTILMIFK